jgi:hypothetical protein
MVLGALGGNVGVSAPKGTVSRPASHSIREVGQSRRLQADEAARAGLEGLTRVAA